MDILAYNSPGILNIGLLLVTDYFYIVTDCGDFKHVYNWLYWE